MKLILDKANNGSYGVGVFNVNNMEQLQAICDAAPDISSPVIIQVSRNALKYANKGLLSEMANNREGAFHKEAYSPSGERRG